MAITILTTQPSKQSTDNGLKNRLTKLEIMLDLALDTDEIRRRYTKNELFEMVLHFRGQSQKFNESALVLQKQPMHAWVQTNLTTLEKFLALDLSIEVMLREYVTDELFLMLMYFRERCLKVELYPTKDLLGGYEEVQYV